jgi:hypothetical protein
MRNAPAFTDFRLEAFHFQLNRDSRETGFAVNCLAGTPTGLEGRFSFRMPPIDGPRLDERWLLQLLPLHLSHAYGIVQNSNAWSLPSNPQSLYLVLTI